MKRGVAGLGSSARRFVETWSPRFRPIRKFLDVVGVVLLVLWLTGFAPLLPIVVVFGLQLVLASTYGLAAGKAIALDGRAPSQHDTE